MMRMKTLTMVFLFVACCGMTAQGQTLRDDAYEALTNTSENEGNAADACEEADATISQTWADYIEAELDDQEIEDLLLAADIALDAGLDDQAVGDSFMSSGNFWLQLGNQSGDPDDVNYGFAIEDYEDANTPFIDAEDHFQNAESLALEAWFLIHHPIF